MRRIPALPENLDLPVVEKYYCSDQQDYGRKSKKC